MIYYTFYSFFIWKLLMFLYIFLTECEKCTVTKNRILELKGALKEHLGLTLFCPWVKLRPFGSSLGPESCLLKNMENSWLLTPFLSSVPKSGEGAFSSFGSWPNGSMGSQSWTRLNDYHSLTQNWDPKILVTKITNRHPALTRTKTRPQMSYIIVLVIFYLSLYIYIYHAVFFRIKIRLCSVVSDSLQPHGLQPTRLLRPWDFPGKSTGVGCHRVALFLVF